MTLCPRLPPGYFREFVDPSGDTPGSHDSSQRHYRTVGPKVRVVGSGCSYYDRSGSGSSSAVFTTCGAAVGDTLWEEDALVVFSKFERTPANVTAEQSAFQQHAATLWAVMQSHRQQQPSDEGGEAVRYSCCVSALAAAESEAEAAADVRRALAVLSTFVGGASCITAERCWPTKEQAQPHVGVAALLMKALAAAFKKKGSSNEVEEGEDGTKDASSSIVVDLAILGHIGEQRKVVIYEPSSSSSKQQGSVRGSVQLPLYALFAIASFACRVRMDALSNSKMELLEGAGDGGGDSGKVLRVRCVATKPLAAGEEVKLSCRPLAAVAPANLSRPMSQKERALKALEAVKGDPAAMGHMLQAVALKQQKEATT